MRGCMRPGQSAWRQTYRCAAALGLVFQRVHARRILTTAGGCCLQVMPIELPGHGSRMKEPRLTDLCQLSAEAVAAIEPHIR